VIPRPSSTSQYLSSRSLSPRENKPLVQARAAGLPIGILSSSDYPSLNPGYWVIVSRVFDTGTVTCAGLRARVR
jgi:hypothetical protein